MEQLSLLEPEKRCSLCFAKVEVAHKTRCITCQRKSLKTAPIASCFDYFGAIQNVVSAFISGQKLFFARSLAAYLLIQHDCLGWPNPDIITFVPESWLLSRLKGSHANRLLAKELANMMNIPLMPLTQKRYYGVGKSYFQKKSDAHHATNKTILLVTLLLDQDTERIKDALQEISPKGVYILTLCRKEENE